MYLLLKWLILGWSLVVVLLWGFLSFRQWQSGEALFPGSDDLIGFMAMVFLTWLVPIAVFAFFMFLGKPKKE
jgi:putative exporter of polyketide antibiotics